MIEGYILFCLTTAIVGGIQIYTPIHNKLLEKHINNIVTKSPKLSYCIFALFCFITAPILFIILMIHPAKVVFIDAMYDSIIKD